MFLEQDTEYGKVFKMTISWGRTEMPAFKLREDRHNICLIRFCIFSTLIVLHTWEY